MNQKLTFTAFLQDEYSKKFDKLADRTDADIKKIEKDLNKLSKTGKTAALSINDLNKRIDVLTRVKKLSIDTRAIKFAGQEIKALEIQKARLEKMGSGGGGIGGGGIGMSALGVAGGIGIAGFATAALSAGKDLVVNSTKAYMNYEAIVETFKVLAKDDQAGTALAERLNKFQQETILGPEVFKSAQTLMAFGVGLNDVEKDIKMIGDVSQGSKDKMASLILAFAQTQSAGRLMGQDLLQYVNAGFNPLQTMSERWKEFGFNSKKSVGDLRKDMEKGLISSDMVAKSFELATSKGGLFNNMLQKVGTTTFGQAQQFEGQWESFKISLGERFKPSLEGSLSMLSSITASVKKWVEIPASQKIQEQATNLRALKAQLMDTNIQETRRKEILAEIQNQYGSYLKNIDLEKASYEDLNKALDNTILLLDKKSKKARLDEILKDATDGLNAEYRAQASVVSGMYKIGAKIAPEIMNREGLNTEDKIALLTAKLNEKGKYGEGYKYEKERQTLYGTRSLNDVNTGIAKAQTNLKETTALIEKQMKDEGLSNLDGTPKAGGDGKGGKGGTSSTTKSGTSIPSISGGSRVTHLTINIGALVKDGVHVYKATAKEGIIEASNIVKEQLLTAVNDANLAVGRNN